MGYKFFYVNARTLLSIGFIILLISSLVLNIIKNTNVAFAAVETCDGKGENCRIIKVKANGSDRNVSPTQIGMVVSGNQINYSVTGTNSDGDCNITLTSGSESRTIGSWNFDQIDHVEVYTSDGATLLASTAVTAQSSGTITVPNPSGNSAGVVTLDNPCETEGNDFCKIKIRAIQYGSVDSLGQGSDAVQLPEHEIILTPSGTEFYVESSNTANPGDSPNLIAASYKYELKQGNNVIESTGGRGAVGVITIKNAVDNQLYASNTASSCAIREKDADGSNDHGLANDRCSLIPSGAGKIRYLTIKFKSNIGTGGEGEESTCHGTAGAIGWILCPVLEFAADAAQWAYTAVVEPSLHTNPELFQIDGERNGTYQAWGIFRNIANILFAILLLFVILSQVSGIGIDNYGIKKILPKLIVSAFLINVSFFICQALIDLSNIVGSGVYGLLTNIASGITIPEGTGNLSAGGSIALGVIGVVVAAGVGTAIGGAAFWGAIGSALLAFVPVLISAVVAILFLFALLAMRQAVVVILVALSPLAFVAYTLPNTKRLFDRWSQLLRGMLLLYPICALLMAGGRLASRVIFASGAGENNLGIILTAMAAEIVPLFFIPTVVRSAYNATGHLGAALNNLHGRMVGGTRNGIRNSQRFQRANQRQQYRRAMQAANPNSGFMRRYRRASRSSNPVAQAYARWATGRAAAINQNARQLATQQGQQQALAGMNPNQIDAARNEARTNTEKQLINQANYGSAQFNAAVINEATSQADDARKRQLMWNSASYVAGKEAEALTARQNEAANAVQYGTPGYAERERLKNRATRERAAAENATWDADRVTAETTKAVEEARSQRENVLHYNDADFAQGVRMRNEAEAEKSLHDTKNWDMDRRNAEITKGAVESDAQRANALLYNETNFASRERSKNEAETNRRREENATWSDARRDAVTHKARIESEAQRDNDLLYNDTDFRVREERKHSVDTQKRQIENESWTPDRKDGEVRKARVEAKAQRENAELYTDENFAVREERRNETDTKRRKIENATWTDKRARGEVYKAEIEAGAQQANAELYTKTAVREGEQRRSEAQTKIKEAEARSWTEQRASGEVHKAQLDAKAQEANASLYNSAAYRAHEQTKNETQTETRKIENATWTSDRKAAEVAKAKNDALRTELNTANYNDANYVRGERNKIRTDAERSRLETTTWTDARRTGEVEKARIETEAQKENAMLYNRTAFREGEQRKAETQTAIRRKEGESWTEERAAGEVTKAAISTETQAKSAAQYADTGYAARERRKADTNIEQQKIENATWTPSRASGEVERTRISADAQQQSAVQYNDETYRTGKQNQNKLNQRNDRKTTELYARDDYRQSRERQQDVVISNETTKMYSDQFSRMSMNEVMGRLHSSVADGTTRDRIEQFTAASNALIQSGQADKVRDIITSGDSDVSKKFGDLIRTDKEFRDRAAQVLGSSGEFTFQEYAKHLGQSKIVGGKSTAMSFEEWVQSPDGLAASVAKKGIGRLDKDALKYLAQHPVALQATFSKASAEDISKVAASTADTATVTELTKAIRQLNETQRAEIIRSTSAERAANMDPSIRDALVGIEPGDSDEVKTTKNAAWREQIGKAIAASAQIAARFSKEAREAYVSTEEPKSEESSEGSDGDG